MASDNAALLDVVEAWTPPVSRSGSDRGTNDLPGVIDVELTAVIGAGPWERSSERTAQRNGSRPRTLTTTSGDLEHRIH